MHVPDPGVPVNGSLLDRLDARDRRLFLRFALGADAPAFRRRLWIGLTTLGSAAVTIGLVVVPALLRLWPRAISWQAGAALLVSHLMIQILKRLVGRERPSEGLPGHAVIANPDRFSFPSGHSASSLAIALSYAVAFPGLTAPLVALGILVGWSRVALGVHYPGDVLAGQTIAALTVLLLPG